MAKVNANRLLELVRMSGLVDADPLAAALAELKKKVGSEPVDADALADWFVEQNIVTRWQATNLLEGRHKGFFLGKYKLLGHLGTGGMSTVYLAEHMLMQRRVALKVLPEKRVDDSSYLARFQREAKAAASLDHPNIVRAFDVNCEGRTHFLVMEYVPGRDLQSVVKADGPLAFDTAMEYIGQAAQALHHAHEAGIIHRDIKPANLLLDEAGVVKVLDMGLARFEDDDQPSLTIAHNENVLGTADYLAPEQAVNSHKADARADIYSLGCTMYFLLSGHPPFPDGALSQRLIAHQTKEPKPLQEIRPDVPADLLKILHKMTRKKAGERYQSVLELLADINAWRTTRGIQPYAVKGMDASPRSGGPASPKAASARGGDSDRGRGGVAVSGGGSGVGSGKGGSSKLGPNPSKNPKPGSSKQVSSARSPAGARPRSLQDTVADRGGPTVKGPPGGPASGKSRPSQRSSDSSNVIRQDSNINERDAIELGGSSPIQIQEGEDLLYRPKRTATSDFSDRVGKWFKQHQRAVLGTLGVLFAVLAVILALVIMNLRNH